MPIIRNRGTVDLRRLADEAGRAEACVYRLGLRAPGRGSREQYAVRVRVRGRALPFRWRVRFLDEVVLTLAEESANWSADMHLPAIKRFFPSLARDWCTCMPLPLSPTTGFGINVAVLPKPWATL